LGKLEICIKLDLREDTSKEDSSVVPRFPDSNPFPKILKITQKRNLFGNLSMVIWQLSAFGDLAIYSLIRDRLTKLEINQLRDFCPEVSESFRT